MSSTEIVNRTSRALDMQVGNCRYFIKLATLEKNQSYTARVAYNDTYMEFSLGTDSTDKALIVSSDECVDNRTIIVREVDGRFHVEMQPRVQPTSANMSASSSSKSVIAECEPLKKRPCTFWRLSMF